MTRINLHEAKARLSYYAKQVKAGETIILCDRNRPFAEIRPLPEAAARRPRRKLGLMKGWFPVPDGFNSPDPELDNLVENTPIVPPHPVASRTAEP